MKIGSGSLQGTPEAVGLLASSPGLVTLITGVEIAGYLGPDCSPIDINHCIEFRAVEFEGGNNSRGCY